MRINNREGFEEVKFGNKILFIIFFIFISLISRKIIPKYMVPADFINIIDGKTPLYTN